MGNEMPNRNLQTGPEEDSTQNQTSQQSSVSGVVPIEKDKPTSKPSVEGPKAGLSSGSKEETRTNKDTMASKAKISAIDGDQHVQDENYEGNMQRPAISYAADAPHVSADKSTDHQEAVVPSEESIKGEDRSSKTEKLLATDTENDSTQNQTPQQSSADCVDPIEKDMPEAMLSEEGPKDDLDSGLKEETISNRDGLASEVINSSIEGDEHVQGKNSQEIMQKLDISHAADAGGQQVQGKNSQGNMQKSEISHAADVSDGPSGKSIHIGAEENKQRVDHQEAVVPVRDYIKGEDGISKTYKLLPNDTEKDSMQNQTPQQSSAEYVDPIEMDRPKGMPSVEGPKDNLGSGLKEETISNKDALASDVNTSSIEGDQRVQCKNSQENMQKLEILHAADAGDQHVQGKNSQENMQKSEINHAAGASDGLSGKSIHIGGEENKQRVDHQEAVVPVEDYIKGEDRTSTTDKLLHNDTDKDKQTRDKDALQSETQGLLVTGLPSADTQKMPSPQASGNAAGARDIQNHPVMPMQMPSRQQHGLKENSTANKNISVNEKCYSNVKSTTMPNGLQLVSETKQDVDILQFSQKEMPTELDGSKESIKEPSEAFVNNEIREGEISTKNEIIFSEMSNGFLHHEYIKAKEETVAPRVGKLDTSADVLSEKHAQENQVINSVERMEKDVTPPSTLDAMQEINSFLLHEGTECKNETVPEMRTGVIKNPDWLQSKSDLIQDNKGKTETNLTATEVIRESITLVSPSVHVEPSDMTLLQELKVESYNDKVSNAVEKLGKPALKHCSDEVLQNEHHRGRDTGPKDEATKGLSDSEFMDKKHKPLLVETENKSSSTSATLSTNEVCLQTQMFFPGSSASIHTNEDEGNESMIEKKEIDSATVTLEKNDQALQSQNDQHTDVALNGMTKKDEIIILESEVNKLGGCEGSTSSVEFSSNQNEKKSAEKLHNSSCLNKMDTPQKQDVSRDSLNEMQKQDVSAVSTINTCTENGMLSISEKELPMWTATNITTTASTLDDPAPDMTREFLITTGDKSNYTQSSDSELHPSDYVSCPKLESWHEESEDDVQTPLLATAEGSPEEKKEAVLQGNLNTDDANMSLERTDSERARIPLCHLFTEDSSVAGSEQTVMSNKQENSKEKSVEEVWGTPARIVSTRTSKEKQKSRSIFGQCLCCSPVN